MKAKIKTHWVADIFPLNESDIDAIAEDIKANGQKLPIQQLSDGRIVDGRNRWLACQKIGVDPVVEVINNGEIPSDEELEEIANRYNGLRRDRTIGQKACGAAIAWKKLHPGETRGGNMKTKTLNSGFCNYAKKRGVGKSAAEKALAVLNHSEELIQAALQDGDLEGAYQTFQKEKADRAKNATHVKFIKSIGLEDQLAEGKKPIAELFAEAMRLQQEQELKERTRMENATSVANTFESFVGTGEEPLFESVKLGAYNRKHLKKLIDLIPDIKTKLESVYERTR